MTIQISLFEQLIALVADPVLAEQLRTRYYEDLRAQTSFVQSRMGNLELDLRETLQQSLGVTNTMIADAVAAVRDVQSAQREHGAAVLAAVRDVQSTQSEQGAAVTALRTEFQQVAESVDELADRDTRQYEESRQDRAEIRARQDRVEERQEHIEIAVAALRARLDARPSPEKAQATYDGVQRILTHLGLPLDESEHTVGDG